MIRAFAAGRLGTSAVVALCVMVSLAGCTLPDASPAAPAVQAAAGPAQARAAEAPATGSKVRNPANGRFEAVVPDISGTALLVGDSQSEPLDGWPRQALMAAGYKVYFCGRGGTGFVSANGSTGNYIDALRRGEWLLPSGTPALIVIQGGGNDAASGASDRQIAANAESLIRELQARYPGTRMAMIGTLARSKEDGGGRRTEVNTLLGSVAADHRLPFVSVGDWLTRYGLAKELADAVHMKPAGRRMLGMLLEQRLRDLRLERKQAPDTAAVLAAGASGATQD